ncbi:MAG: hypothetical protein V2J51_07405 [Erythrobacter sp.]|jgi:hypothetical protein|nr:hypothetical protein [Erythrobacter sp.]
MSSTQTGTANSQGGAIKDELKNDAEQLKQSAQAEAERTAENQREQAVNAARSTSSAIDTAARELREDENAPDWLASMLTSAGSQIEKLAGDMEGKSATDMMRSAQNFGRSNPAAFLASCAAAGFAAGRMMRAGAEQHDDIDMVQPNGDQTGSASDSQTYSGRAQDSALTTRRETF